MRRLTCGALALILASLLALPAGATPPGRNGKLIWQRQPLDGLPHLWIAEPDGSGAQQVLVRGGGLGEFEGTFSPTDPNVVFFTGITERPYSDDIFTGNLATGVVTRVTRARSADIGATVSPDGTRIVYFAAPRPRRLDPDVPGPPERIRVANLDGSSDRAITPRRRRSIDPDWSPDGSQVVYCEVRLVGRRLLPQFRLVVVDADGGGRRALTRFGGTDEINPKWMPDGQTIVFERARRTGLRSDIATVRAEGGGLRTILSTRAWETNPIPSPDGTRFAFTSDRHRPGRDRINPSFELYTMAVDGSDIVRLTNNRQLDLFPDWQRLP